VIGFAGLLSGDALGEQDYELGFVLRRSAWGNGYAAEIGHGQLDYGFNVLRLTPLLALVSPKNSASIAVLEKIGMTFHSNVNDAQRGTRHVHIARNEQGR
jgi:[ribosomal protein S5]-alanine N-acetyltransferase